MEFFFILASVCTIGYLLDQRKKDREQIKTQFAIISDMMRELSELGSPNVKVINVQ